MSNLTIFDLMYKKYKINKPIRLIELFAGIGSQAKALENLGVKFEHYKVCEFNKYSITSYNAIHGTSFETSDITKLKGEDLEITDTDKYCYIMTYSFPCQDLSLAGKQRGMEKGKGTRSGLLWEVEFKNEKEPLYRKLCNTLIEKDLLKQDDVILYSYSNNRLNNGIENMKRTTNKDRRIFPTLTTRNDRFGVVVNEPEEDIWQKFMKRIRKITPLECWRLMGFSDEDFYKAKEALNNTFKNGQDKSNSQLYMQAGNSIVVSVLMAIFAKLLDIDYKEIINKTYNKKYN